MITACIFVVCSWSWSSPLCFENKRRRSVLEANLHRPPARPLAGRFSATNAPDRAAQAPIYG